MEDRRPHDGRMSKFLMVSSVDQKLVLNSSTDNMFVCLSLRALSDSSNSLRLSLSFSEVTKVNKLPTGCQVNSASDPPLSN